MKTIKRAWLKWQISSLDIQIDGMAECLECVADPLTRQRIIFARAIARRELARIRAEYNATFEPGVRRVWDLA